MNHKRNLPIYLVLGGVLFFALVTGCMYASYNNSEVSLRHRADAQQENLKVVHDRTWKIIQQQAQVSDRYRESFNEIYPALMEGRYGNARGGSLLSFIQESNPEFDVSLFKQLSASIEAQRTSFAREQKILLDIKRDHDVLLDSFPSSMFVGGRERLRVNVVTSTRTERTFDMGVDDEVDLFGDGGN